MSSRNNKSNRPKHYKRYRDNIQDKTQEAGTEGAGMSFEEIAEELNLSVPQVKMIYTRAMKKLKLPNDLNRVLWEYDNIGSSDTLSDMAGRTL